MLWQSSSTPRHQNPIKGNGVGAKSELQHQSQVDSSDEPLNAQADRLVEVATDRIPANETSRQPRKGRGEQLIPDGLKDPVMHLAQAKTLKHPFDSMTSVKTDHADAAAWLAR